MWCRDTQYLTVTSLSRKLSCLVRMLIRVLAFRLRVASVAGIVTTCIASVAAEAPGRLQQWRHGRLSWLSIALQFQSFSELQHHDDESSRLPDRTDPRIAGASPPIITPLDYLFASCLHPLLYSCFLYQDHSLFAQTLKSQKVCVAIRYIIVIYSITQQTKKEPQNFC